MAALLVAAAATGFLPRLVAVHAFISAILTMCLAPLWLLDHGTLGRLRRVASKFPLPAVMLVGAGTIAVQLPGVVTWMSGGGLPALAGFAGLMACALVFWAVVIGGAPRLTGLAAGGYVIGGGLPISMPAMLLILIPRDVYSGLHAAAPPAIGGLTDQLLAGMFLFASVKIAIFAVFTAVFLKAAGEVSADDDDGGGGRPQRTPPQLPGWVRAIYNGAPTVDEPAVTRDPSGALEPAGRR